ncbi:uncharacterized protein V1518DRAFT_411048 [Limtongia smithiae]|uniref:uncharacterized protein n=1 Tax=Limtongia smithiae TaxID=1125753 RepID=UPI0034CFB974
MMMSKKIDRFKQWTSEKLGQETKTQESDEFKELEYEITMRYEGTERLHQSMVLYVRNLSKRRELDELEKASPIDILGQALAIYGEEFVEESTYGQALSRLGAANQRLAKTQEMFVDRIQHNFLEGIEKSIAQFKDFQAARKKLEYRRLAYDTALSKVQKLKREDVRLEEEVRAQRIKYEEAGEDVVRKMNAIRDAETDCLADLVDFFEGECEYYERCNEILVALKKNWITDVPSSPKTTRSRSASTSLKSFVDRDDSPPPVRRPTLRSLQSSSDSAGAKYTVDTPIGLSSSSISSGKFSAVINPPRLNRSTTEPPVLPGPRPSLGPKKKMVKANFRYEAEDEDELSLEPGDIVIVKEEIDAGWWIGELAGGERSGLFPVPYCTVISEGVATSNGPAKPAKPSISRKTSSFSAESLSDKDEEKERPKPVTAPSYQSSMKKLSSGGIVGSGKLANPANSKKAPPPPPKRTGVIGAVGAR